MLCPERQSATRRPRHWRPSSQQRTVSAIRRTPRSRQLMELTRRCAEYRLTLKRVIYSAWAKRRNITTDIVDPLSCYNEKEPYENRGLIETKPTACDREESCCLATPLRARAEELRKMKQAIDDTKSARREDSKRAQALRFLLRKKEQLTDAMCRDLGDAVFVAFSPSDAVILTTNTRDYLPLANSIGKQVQTPTA